MEACKQMWHGGRRGEVQRPIPSYLAGKSQEIRGQDAIPKRRTHEMRPFEKSRILGTASRSHENKRSANAMRGGRE